MKIDKRKLNIYVAKTCKNISEIASDVGINAVTLNRILAGAQQPRRSTIGKLAKALCVEVTDILDE